MSKDFLYQTDKPQGVYDMIKWDIDFHGEEFVTSMDRYEFELHYGIPKDDFLYNYSVDYSNYTQERLTFATPNKPLTSNDVERLMDDFRSEAMAYLTAPKLTDSGKAKKVKNASNIQPKTSVKPSETKEKANNKPNKSPRKPTAQ